MCALCGVCAVLYCNVPNDLILHYTTTYCTVLRYILHFSAQYMNYIQLDCHVDAMPLYLYHYLIHRWYLDLETLEVLTDFSERVVEAVRANDPKAQIGQDKDTPHSTPPSPSRPVPFDPTHVLGLIKDLSAFQLSCLHTDRAYKSAEALLQDRPDELLNRTVAHVKYLFGVPSLEGTSLTLPPSLSLVHSLFQPIPYPPFYSTSLPSLSLPPSLPSAQVSSPA